MASWLRTSLVCATALLASALLVVPALAQPSVADFQKCAKRIKNAVLDFSDDYLDAFLNCEVERVTKGRESCVGDSQAEGRARGALQELRSKVNKCKRGADKALCPLEGRSGAEIHARIVGSPLPLELEELNVSLFRTEHDGCARPPGAVSRAASDCAKRVQQAARQAVVDAQECLFSCEVSKLANGGEPCVDATGRPSKAKVVSCYEEALADAVSLLRSKCDEPLLRELGCPAGETTITDLAASMLAVGATIAEPLNLGLYHSRCREVPRPPVNLPPPVAEVTLRPSGETRVIPCGQVIDRQFMAGNRQLVLESDVSCEAVEGHTDGLVIAMANLTLDGKGKWSIVGPATSRYRTGAGIRLAAGARNVRIRRVRQIRRFGYGIVDSGANRELRVDEVTLFRNAIAGVSLSSNKVRLEEVTADRNAVGFELRGDEQEIKASIARGSTPAPGIGVHLRGVDRDGNGLSASVRESVIEGNMVGVLAEGVADRVSANVITDSSVTGVELTGVAAKVDQNSVKRTAGDGIVVAGTANVVRKNRIEESGGTGVVVAGTASSVRNNTAGTNGRGNLSDGFLVGGVDATIESNKADGNRGTGFVVVEPTAKLKGNRARRNTADGFVIGVPGNRVESNIAAENGGSELVIAPGNVDRPGSNRANGSRVSFGPEGGTFE